MRSRCADLAIFHVSFHPVGVSEWASLPGKCVLVAELGQMYSGQGAATAGALGGATAQAACQITSMTMTAVGATLGAWPVCEKPD